MVSSISNSESANFLNFQWFFFSTGKLRKKTCFGPIGSLFSFSTAHTEKNSWKKLVKHVMNSLISRIPKVSANVFGNFLTFFKKGQKGTFFRLTICKLQVFSKKCQKGKFFQLSKLIF